MKILYLLILSVAILPSAAFAQYAIPGSVTGNGGAVISNTSYRISGTFGQAVTGLSENSSNRTGAGFWYASHDYLTSVEQIPFVQPIVFSLEQNYPNPFNPQTVIKFSLPESGNVSIKIYDILGKELYELLNEERHSGEYEVVLNTNNTNLSSGVYFYTIKSNSYTSTKKMILTK